MQHQPKPKALVSVQEPKTRFSKGNILLTGKILLKSQTIFKNIFTSNLDTASSVFMCVWRCACAWALIIA